MIHLYALSDGLCAVHSGHAVRLPFLLDDLFVAADPHALLLEALRSAPPSELPPPASWRAPIGSQEVWAAGVTYFRSRTARMEESKDAGGGSFYDKVYHAPRPELFFKATPHRVVGPGAAMRLRGDARWNVPEPELTLAFTAQGRLFGCTVGNDLSSRDIEGENPLYLPQAKVWATCAALGPCLLVTPEPLPAATEIALEIVRDGQPVFTGATSLAQIKRTFAELADYLFRDNAFPRGCYLMTGTGIVPPDMFTLRSGDEMRITIAAIGTLSNTIV
jgi:2-dehydro-3-deoxy-D-arabinonate dehydratase